MVWISRKVELLFSVRVLEVVDLLCVVWCKVHLVLCCWETLGVDSFERFRIFCYFMVRFKKFCSFSNCSRTIIADLVLASKNLADL